ncbi:MAG TPA: hypothetical protein VI503_07940 [Gaiellaceae bacterium]|nr:hypothetical protein [Gaiellaceae bacterium]
MDPTRFTRLSPAFVVAMLALFFALGGTAGAIATQAVPLAKRALVADNAKKVGGQTAAQITAAAAARPGPANSAAGLVSIKTSAVSIPAEGSGPYTVSCDGGQKIAGAGYTGSQALLLFASYPESDSAWQFYLVNLNETAPASTTLYATCIR